jgi:hypothetical protein
VQWEYVVLEEEDAADNLHKLAEYGRQGWELVAVLQDCTGLVRFFLKRAVH